jgi:hypothetical protein
MMENGIKHDRFVILGEVGSYIVKDILLREFVATKIRTLDTAERIREIFESDAKTEER